MRQIIYIILFLLTLTSCKSKTDIDSGNIIVFKGKLASKYPISLWLTKKQDVIIGQVVYLKGSKKPIKLIGTPYNNQIEFTEFLEDGSVCGIWKGKIENNRYTGIWYSVNGNKEYQFRLNICDTTLISIDTNITTTDYTGHYKYQHGSKGYQGSITIEKHGDQYSLSCVNVTSAPSRNMAEFEIDSIEIIGNESLVDLNGDGLCIFRIKYFKDFIIINSIDDKRDCGFGLNAYVDGIYIKTIK